MNKELCNMVNDSTGEPKRQRDKRLDSEVGSLLKQRHHIRVKADREPLRARACLQNSIMQCPYN